MKNAIIQNIDGSDLLPVVVVPSELRAPLAPWVKEHREQIDELLLEFGAILFRDWGAWAPEHFDAFIHAAGREPWDGPKAVFNMRERVQGAVFTSTEAPSNYRIRPHSEFAHSPFRRWPSRLTFFCERASSFRGETPLTPTHKVIESLNPKIVDLFIKRGLRYTRTFRAEETNWRNAFQTDDRSAVEQRCREYDIDYEWQKDGRDLQIHWRSHTGIIHPQTGRRLWFNFAHVVAASTFSLPLLALATYNRSSPMADATFADGEPIPAAMLFEIIEAYDQETVHFVWRASDVLLLDNMAVAHGRRPYRGDRRVLAGMMDAIGSPQVQTF